MKVEIEVDDYTRWHNSGYASDLYNRFMIHFSRLIREELDMDHRDLTSLTCNVKKFSGCHSVGGHHYMAEKIIKYKISGTLNIEAELVDDFEVPEDEWRERRETKKWGFYECDKVEVIEE